jgi:adenosylhomocysteine nucleosidase
MTVVVMSALRSEIDVLVGSLGDPRPADIAGWPVWTGDIGATSVVLAQAGLGKVNTGALAALLWQTHTPHMFVFTGVAGGLDPRLQIGDVVIAERTIQHDAGVVVPPGTLERYQPGHIPFLNPTEEHGYSPTKTTLARLHSIAGEVTLTEVLGRHPNVVFGTILTGDQFVQDPGTRDRLFTEFGAQAIEMEGAALGQVASRLGVDHVVIRSLSDLAGGEADVDFTRFLPEVSANSARLVQALLARLEEDDGYHTLGP